MSQWVSVRLSKEETVHINIANIVKISSTLGQTILHYVNGDRELLSGQQAKELLEVVNRSVQKSSVD